MNPKEFSNYHTENIKPRPSLKNVSIDKISKDTEYLINHKQYSSACKKRLSWDMKNIEEHEIEKINNPKMKIDEPKTPYIYHEDEDNVYLSKLTEINRLQPTVFFNEFYRNL